MNILPVHDQYWTLYNCIKTDLSFTFTDAGYAKAYITEVDDLTHGRFTAIVFASVPVECRIVIRQGASYETATCLLNAHSDNFYSADLDFSKDEFDEAYVELIAAGECAIQQLSLDVEVQSFEEVIEELKTELPKLLEDYNIYDLTLTTEEVTVGLITANLLKDTDLQGHFAVSFIASSDAEIVMRIYDDLHKCLYSPSIITVKAGKHVIGFPHSYLKSKAGFHNFYVTMQATSGTVKIPTRALLYTIDGAHITERLLDSFYVVNDVTAQVTAASIEPTSLYAIGVVDNVASIRHIAPNQLGISNWTVDFIIPNVKEAAIEFNGSWYPGVARNMFVTDQLPMVFYTDMNDTLWAQYFNSEQKTQLATGVKKISAVRGYRYADQFVSNDMGLVCAYIKNDGKAYYRQFMADGQAYWTIEDECVFDAASLPLQSIKVNRTNDFRMVFTVQDNNGNAFAAFTRRYYQADSVEHEFISASTYLKPNLATIIYPAFEYSWNESNTELFVSFSHSVLINEGAIDALYLKDNANKVYDILDVNQVSSKLLALTTESIGGFSAPISIHVDDTYKAIWVEHDGSTFYVPSSSLVIDAEDFSPKAFTDEAIFVDTHLEIKLKEEDTSKLYHAEHIYIDSSMELDFILMNQYDMYHSEHICCDMYATFVLTQVGSEPL